MMASGTIPVSAEASNYQSRETLAWSPFHNMIISVDDSWEIASANGAMQDDSSYSCRQVVYVRVKIAMKRSERGGVETGI